MIYADVPQVIASSIIDLLTMLLAGKLLKAVARGDEKRGMTHLWQFFGSMDG